jgi:L-ascorbate metabolism protein UlaG (beta-lactamase superfamily)
VRLLALGLTVLCPVLAGCSGGGATATPFPELLTIGYGQNAQVEIAAPRGPRIYFDVWNPSDLAEQPMASDVLLVSHPHRDHYLAEFAETFPGAKLVDETGELTVGVVAIRSIPASHSDAPVNPEAPDNHILIVDYGAIRVVHMGSTGQVQLTAEQLAAIGKPDILIAPLANVGGDDPGCPLLPVVRRYADGSLADVGGGEPGCDKAILIVEQIGPRLIVPSHINLGYARAAGEVWPAAWSAEKAVVVPRTSLPSETRLLFLGPAASSYGALLGAAEWQLSGR